MIVRGFGEVLTDVMTVNPALPDIPSASSILDASNFTFQAVTFGKDAEGFTRHSHSISSTHYVNGDSASGASSYNSGYLTIINLGSNAANGASSYVTSATYLQYSATYNSVPNDPSVEDLRLERGSTSSTNLYTYQYASSLPDLGHYPNAGINSDLSSIWNVVGGFVPSAGAEDYAFRFYDKNSSFIYSGYVSSFFNNNQLMDENGYLTVSPSSVSDYGGTPEYSNGAVLLSGTSYQVSDGSLKLDARLLRGDAVTLAAFGGVKHIGVYCLDLKDMLASGLTPPYSWDALNNNRKYKLVAKATLLDDILYHRDYLTFPGLSLGLNANNVVISLSFDFK